MEESGLRHRIHSTGGFWLVLGTLLWAAPFPLVLAWGLACLVHEGGHGMMLRALGGRVEGLTLTGLGAVLRPRRARLFSYGEECLLALAGPGASVLLAVLVGSWPGFGGLMGKISLALGLFNLLPAWPLDGGRVVRAALSQLAGPTAGRAVCRVLTGLLAGMLLLTGLWGLRRGSGAALLWVGIWLFVQTLRGI